MPAMLRLQAMTQGHSHSKAPENNEMQLTRSAWANGRARPLQLIAVFSGR